MNLTRRQRKLGKEPARLETLLLGIAVGDALGVPVEFMERGTFYVDGMMGHGTHDQPAGTWSDDTSLTLALADALDGSNVSLPRLAKNVIAWHDRGAFTPHGIPFDIGNTTVRAIARLKRGLTPERSGCPEESDNGNGSLMRIAPLVCILADRALEERYRLTQAVSSVTHAHPWAVTACFLFLEFLLKIYTGQGKDTAYAELQREFANPGSFINAGALAKFQRLLRNDIRTLPESEIRSGGFVVDTLEAAVWCFLTTATYKDAVLKAVNLGEDTDTTAAVTGALAALAYGIEAIPLQWRDELKGKDQIYRIISQIG